MEVIQFETLSLHSSGGAEENHSKHQSVSGPRSEPGTIRIRIKNATQPITIFRFLKCNIFF
jgi:hypothetical protein